ncbi:MAG: hypothetical protein LBS05_09460 [Tannerellaceae bacterium]|jgi:hypothetical protein|nr:hypothetical protein [Tannerellaceae bacterium]
MKLYAHLITVTVKAPKGYRPGRAEYRSLAVSRSRKFKTEAEGLFLSEIKNAYAELTKKVPLIFLSTSVTHEIHGINVEDGCFDNPREEPEV